MRYVANNHNIIKRIYRLYYGASFCCGVDNYALNNRIENKELKHLWFRVIG